MEIFGTFVCIFLWVMCLFLLLVEVYYGYHSRDIAHREANAADGLAPFGVKPSAVFCW